MEFGVNINFSCQELVHEFQPNLTGSWSPKVCSLKFFIVTRSRRVDPGWGNIGPRWVFETFLNVKQ